MATVMVVLIAVLSLHFAHLRPVNSDEDWRMKLKQKQHIWELSGKYQGDIILPKVIYQSRNAMYDKKYHWPKKELPYEISEFFSESEKNTIIESLTYLSNNTCIQPIPWRERDQWGIYFSEKPGHGCSTSVGFSGKRQTIHLDVSWGCIQFGVILHEILHSLGMWHQQSAHDRDKYIEIKWDNIIRGVEYNFDKAQAETSSYGLEYDYDSIMHYSRYAFSVNGEQTLIPKIKGGGQNMGQRNAMTPTDLSKLKRMYNCA